MKKNSFGLLGQVSALTLGGGGIGQVWGANTREECVATIHAAIDAGIDLLDTAPMYGNCEAIVGETFAGKLPAGLRTTTKCGLGTPAPTDVEKMLTASLENSLKTMRLDRIDIFFLHSNICPDDYVYAIRPERQDTFATRWSVYRELVIPVFEKLKAAGKIGHWGITASGVPDTIIRALKHTPKPAYAQVVTNLLDSAGSLRRYAEPARPRDILQAANDSGVSVLGIRAVQAGALTAQIDRELSANNPDTKDYDRAAPFRALAKEIGEAPAVLAHRYALAMPGVATVILGVKNRAELAQCVDAAARPLDSATMARIDALGLRG
ncbi:MAG: aldo/keto reductase [Alphaproteobacteria bacterium]|nr:aldo/keto reductase [Alphaproteobacteria bacterium]MBV9905116.1 aldo/keto reductase [Alphaproteobacteria bacterium]